MEGTPGSRIPHLESKAAQGPKSEELSLLPNLETASLEELDKLSDRSMEQAVQKLQGAQLAAGFHFMFEAEAKAAGLPEEGRCQMIDQTLSDAELLKKIRLIELTELASTESIAELTGKSAADPEVQGLLFFALILKNQEGNIREQLGSTEALKNVTLDEAIQTYLAPIVRPAEAIWHVTTKGIDQAEAPDVFQAAVQEKDRGQKRAGEHAGFLNRMEQNSKLSAPALKFLLKVCERQGDMPLSTEVRKIKPGFLWEKDMESFLGSLKQELNEALPYLKQYVHGNAGLEKKVDELIQGKISLSEAVDLAALLADIRGKDGKLETAAQTDAGQALHLQLKLAETLARHDPESGKQLKQLILTQGSVDKLSLPQKTKEALLAYARIAEKPASKEEPATKDFVTFRKHLEEDIAKPTLGHILGAGLALGIAVGALEGVRSGAFNRMFQMAGEVDEFGDRTARSKDARNKLRDRYKLPDRQAICRMLESERLQEQLASGIDADAETTARNLDTTCRLMSEYAAGDVAIETSASSADTALSAVIDAAVTGGVEFKGNVAEVSATGVDPSASPNVRLRRKGGRR